MLYIHNYYYNYFYYNQPIYEKQILYEIKEFFLDLKEEFHDRTKVLFLTNMLYYPLSDLKYSKFLCDTIFQKILEVTDETLDVYFLRYGCCTFDSMLNFIIKSYDFYDKFIIFTYDYISDQTFDFFKKMKILSKDNICRPLDTYRNGLVLSHGYSIFFISKTKSNIEIIRSRITTEPTNGFSPNPKNIGYSKILYIDPKEIDYIKLHATGTKIGDPNEYEYISKKYPDKKLFALKGKIGHTLCSSGGIELGYILDYLHNKRKIPRTYNCNNPIGDNIICDSSPYVNSDKVNILSLSKSISGGVSFILFRYNF